MSGSQDTHDEDVNRTQPGGEAADEPFSERKQAGVTRELQELGRQLVSTARTAWQSEQRRELQQDITMGLRSVADQLNEAVESVRLNPRSEAMKERVSKVTSSARASDLVDDARGTLASGLRELNEQLRRLTERLEREDRATAPGTATTEAPETTPPTSPGTMSSTAGGATLPASDVQVAPPTSTTARASVPDSTPETSRTGDLPGAPEGGADRPGGDGTTRPEGR